MSALSSIQYTSALSSPSSLPVSTAPAKDAAFEPAAIRNGDQTAKKAYQEGLAFENILVNELSQQLAATVPGLNGSSDGDGLGGSSDSSSGSSAGLGAYSSLLPQALSQGLESRGGTGMAMEIARAIDPALNSPPSATASSGAAK